MAAAATSSLPSFGSHFENSKIPFDCNTVDVLLTHEGCTDARTAEVILRMARSDDAPDLVVIGVSPAASELPRDVEMTVFENKNVLICDVTPDAGLLAIIRNMAKNCFVLDHHNTNFNKTGKGCIYTDKASGCALMWGWIHGDRHPPLAVSLIDACDRYDFDELYNLNSLTLHVQCDLREFALGFHQGLKGDNVAFADFRMVLCRGLEEIEPIAKKGMQQRAENAKAFAPMLQDASTSQLHLANTPTNPHGVNILVVNCPNHKMWGQLSEFYFDTVRGEQDNSKKATVMAILLHGTGTNFTPVGQTKYSLRRDNFALSPYDTREISQLYNCPGGRKGGGHAGASAFAVVGTMTVADGVPAPQSAEEVAVAWEQAQAQA